jgi:hypothetical protein
MSRFNLLLVGTSASVRPEILKVLPRGLKGAFIFEAPGMDEAHGLLRKLHVDCMLVDLDALKTDFLAISKDYPNLLIVGVSSNPRAIDIPMNVYQHRMFARTELYTDLAAEFKSLVKGVKMPEDAARKAKLIRPAASADFEDFSVLLKAK